MSNEVETELTEHQKMLMADHIIVKVEFVRAGIRHQQGQLIDCLGENEVEHYVNAGMVERRKGRGGD